MPKNDVKKQRITKLRELVSYHQQKYHEADSPEISDEAYDSLVRELQTLEGSTSESTNSVATKVGGAASEAFAKVKHQVRQWSLDNVFTPVELDEWGARTKRTLAAQDLDKVKISYLLGLKLDGLKLVLEYKDGRFLRAATRGNGLVGEDVTHTARTIAAIPETLPKPIDLICVGEVLLTYKEFDRINTERAKREEPLFANPRNAAAGSVRQLDSEVTRARNLSMIVYDLDYIDVKNTKLKTPATQSDELALLKQLGFTIDPHNKLVHNIEAVQKFYEKWTDGHHKLDYGVDGVVIKIDDIHVQEQLGFTAKSPRFGVAYKFPAEQATTVVEDIQLQVGRTGVVTPVAHLQPVLIDGSTVSRATLHNEDQIKRLDVRIGDTVILQKAGDIIPEIVEVVLALRPKQTKTYRFPKKVEGCGGDGSIERIPGEAAYRCVTLESDFLHRQRLYYLASKQALNIDGVGPRIIDLLLDEGLISHSHDLFTLEVGDLKDLPGFKEKAAQNVVDAIAAARQVPLHRLLIGLSIEHVGEETSRLIAEYCGSIENIQTVSEAELAAIHGIGSTVAKAVTVWMKNQKNCKQLDLLLEHLDIENPQPLQTNSKLKDTTIVFTGTLEHMTRDEAKDKARRAGAHVASSVSKRTDYVVAGAEAGSKVDRASELGVSILSEADFVKMLK